MIEPKMKMLLHKAMRIAATWLSAAAALGATASCTGEAEERPSAIDCVNVSFSLGSLQDAAATKATEAGDNSLNENTITRLDLYVFESGGVLYKHVYCTYGGGITSGYGTLTYSTTPDTDGKCTGTWTMTGLYYAGDALEGKTAYLVANWGAASSASFSTLAKLKAATTGDESFSPMAVQSSFVMDGKAESLSIDTGGNVTATTGDNGKTTYTIAMELSRALSKIRLAVLDKDGKDITTSDDEDEQVGYILRKYAYCASVVADGDYMPPSSELKDANPSASELRTQSGEVVFYSYPNSWYDSSKDMRQEEPIDSVRQTYVTLHAPYTDSDGTTNYYWYKVPVNYRLQEDNDAADATVDQSLYQLQRNHIYDVTVKIDIMGGTLTDPVTLHNVKYQTQDWDDKGGGVTFE